MHDGSQLRKDIGICLWWIWVLSEADFNHGESEGPNVRGNGVCPKIVLRFAFDTFGLQRWPSDRITGRRKITHGHVALTPNVSFRQ